MNNDQVDKIIREYLSNIVHMSLGTCVDNTPWVCEVHFVYDDELNLYWRSKASRRHSQEIAQNPRVAGNIVRQHDLEEAPVGVYFEGRAVQLSGVQVGDSVYQLFADRFAVGPEIIDDANSEDGHQFYKVTVDKMYVFGAFDGQPSQKYQLIR